jgi:hypothetical protein
MTLRRFRQDVVLQLVSASLTACVEDVLGKKRPERGQDGGVNDLTTEKNDFGKWAK